MIKKILTTALLCSSLLFSMSVSELNRATKEDLMKIKGIGEKKADAIMNYRKKNKFTSVDDVANVKGVGASLVENIKKDIKNGDKSKKKTKSSKENKNSKSTKKNSDKSSKTTKTTTK